MQLDFYKIHIGSFIKKKLDEENIEFDRICNMLNCDTQEIEKMLDQEHLDSEILLKWSKLLEYDFFRIYSQHLILYSPPKAVEKSKTDSKKNNALPSFRKNIYTIEIIQYILELIKTNKKTKNQIMIEYNIPKSTLYKWITKYK